VETMVRSFHPGAEAAQERTLIAVTGRLLGPTGHLAAGGVIEGLALGADQGLAAGEVHLTRELGDGRLQARPGHAAIELAIVDVADVTLGEQLGGWVGGLAIIDADGLDHHPTGGRAGGLIGGAARASCAFHI